MASDDNGPDDGGQAAKLAEHDERLGKIEKGVETILGVLGKKPAGQDPPAGSPPGSVADEIARQLDARDARDKAKQQEEADGQWRAKVDQTLAGMTEQPPDPPVRKVETFMKWR